MKILIDIFCFSLKRDSGTRGHEVTFVKYKCKVDIRNYLFTQTTINERNKLSIDYVNASSVNMFKNKDMHKTANVQIHTRREEVISTLLHTHMHNIYSI